jgi:hypothetical protein
MVEEGWTDLVGRYEPVYSAMDLYARYKCEELSQDVEMLTRYILQTPLEAIASMFPDFVNKSVDKSLATYPDSTRLLNETPYHASETINIQMTDGYQLRVLEYSSNLEPVSLTDWNTKATVKKGAYVTFVIAFTNNSNITNADLTDCMSLAEDKESIDILLFNQDATRKVEASCSYGIHAFGERNYYKKLCLLVTTDIHGSQARLQAAIDYINNVECIDAGCCLGDIQAEGFTDNDGSWYYNTVNSCNKPFYTALGNHDVGNTNTTTASTTTMGAFNKFIATTLEGVDKPYYSINLDKYKVTIIVLNNYDTPDTMLDSTTFAVNRKVDMFSQAQLDWLVNTLQNVPSENHVLILTHNFYDDSIAEDCNFVTYGESLGENTSAYGKQNIVPSIINAWINGTSISESFTPLAAYQQYCPVLNVNADFAARGTGNFVGYLAGHLHIDFVGYNAAYTNQKVFGFMATADGTWQNFRSDLPRVENTKSIDCLTTVSIDTDNRLINIVRVGSNVTNRMVKRDMMSLQY